MQERVPRRKKAQVIQKDCVACGCCLKVCPFSAIRIIKGMYASINPEKCVGCGKCAKACPACAIKILGASE